MSEDYEYLPGITTPAGETPTQIVRRLRREHGTEQTPEEIAKETRYQREQAGTAEDRIARALRDQPDPSRFDTTGGAEFLAGMRAELSRTNGITVDPEATKAWREAAVQEIARQASVKPARGRK